MLILLGLGGAIGLWVGLAWLSPKRRQQDELAREWEREAAGLGLGWQGMPMFDLIGGRRAGRRVRCGCDRADGAAMRMDCTVQFAVALRQGLFAASDQEAWLACPQGEDFVVDELPGWRLRATDGRRARALLEALPVLRRLWSAGNQVQLTDLGVTVTREYLPGTRLLERTLDQLVSASDEVLAAWRALGPPPGETAQLARLGEAASRIGGEVDAQDLVLRVVLGATAITAGQSRRWPGGDWHTTVRASMRSALPWSLFVPLPLGTRTDPPRNARELVEVTPELSARFDLMSDQPDELRKVFSVEAARLVCALPAAVGGMEQRDGELALNADPELTPDELVLVLETVARLDVLLGGAAAPGPAP